MLQSLLAKVIGTQNERDLKKLRPIVAQVNALESTIRPLSDEALRGKTAEFRARIANGESLDALMPEAFAVVREAGRRVLNLGAAACAAGAVHAARGRAGCHVDAVTA